MAGGKRAQVARMSTVDRMLRAEGLLAQRNKGVGLAELAAESGLHQDVVQAEIMWIVSWRTDPDVAQYRAMEDARLDDLLRRFEAIASAVDDESVRTEHRLSALNGMLKVAERRAKLWGLDAPTRIAAQVQVEAVLPPDVQALVDEASQRAEQERQRVAGRLIVQEPPAITSAGGSVPVEGG